MFLDYDSSDASYVTTDHDVDHSSDKDSSALNPDDRKMNIEIKREITKPDQKLYAKSLIISKFEVKKAFSIGRTKLTSFHSFSQSRSKRKFRFQGIVSEHDVRLNTIRIANNHIQNGD